MGDEYYTVQVGDTPFEICQSVLRSTDPEGCVKQLFEKNRISGRQQMFVGQLLLLPNVKELRGEEEEVGSAQTIVVSSSNNNLGCGATSIVTITARDGAGKPVAARTLVNIVADKGSIRAHLRPDDG